MPYSWPLEGGAATWPVYRGSQAHMDFGQSAAVDMCLGGVGTHWLAIGDGFCAGRGHDPAAGWFADIQFTWKGEPHIARYCHANSEAGILVKKDEPVTAGQPIGRVGWTGFVLPSQAPGNAHLHLWIRRAADGARIRPESVLDEIAAAPPARTRLSVAAIAALLPANSQLATQMAGWQRARRRLGEDPYDYAAFRAHLAALGAPDPGDVEFLEFCPEGVRARREAVPQFGALLAKWQWERRENGEDPYDYAAFRRHVLAIGAPDCGDVEFGGFCPAGVLPLREANPQFGALLAMWQLARRQNREDPEDYAAFRRHVIAIGAPDCGETPFEGFLG